MVVNGAIVCTHQEICLVSCMQDKYKALLLFFEHYKRRVNSRMQDSLYLNSLISKYFFTVRPLCGYPLFPSIMAAGLMGLARVLPCLQNGLCPEDQELGISQLHTLQKMTGGEEKTPFELKQRF